MKIQNVYSNHYENVILDCEVPVTLDKVDTNSLQFKLVLEAVFRGSPVRQIQNLLSDLPEIKNYVAWADAYLKDSEERYLQEFLPDDADAEETANCRSDWWDAANGGQMDEWPSWELYCEKEQAHGN